MTDLTAQLPALQVVVPLFGAVAVGFTRRGGTAFALALAVTWAAAAISWMLLVQVRAGGPGGRGCRQSVGHVHPRAAARIADAAWAWTQLRSPCRRASSHAAAICASESVCPPPSRMLREAKSLMTSAPRAAVSRTRGKVSSLVEMLTQTPTPAARNAADAARLWEISEKLTGPAS